MELTTKDVVVGCFPCVRELKVLRLDNPVVLTMFPVCAGIETGKLLLALV